MSENSTKFYSWVKYSNDGWNSRVKIYDLISFADKKLAKWD